MDVVSIGMAAAAAKKAYAKVIASAAGHFVAVRTKLARDLENVHIAVYGDSTGKGTGISGAGTDARWPYLFALKIAAAYPTKTVVFHDWDVTTNAYLAPNITVQTGTGTGNAGGPFTVDIWNGSAVGMAPAYSQTYMFSMTPSISPDLIFINHGHNLSVADLTATQAFYGLARDVAAWFNANAPIVFIGQNPQMSPRTTAQINIQSNMVTRVAELCATEGWGFVNVMQAFLDTPSWQSAGYVKTADGVHPETPLGNNLYIDTIWQQWQQAAYATPAATPSRPSRIWIPGNALTPSVLISATPAVAVLSSFLPVMGFGKQAGNVSASVSVHIPASWRSVNIWAYWTTTDGVAGNVVWQTQSAFTQRINQGTASGANAVALALGSASTATGAAPTAVLAESHTLVSALNRAGLTGVAPNQPRTLIVQISRAGSDGSDTYAGTAQLVGVLIERAG